jgi:hypothetical protein
VFERSGLESPEPSTDLRPFVQGSVIRVASRLARLVSRDGSIWVLALVRDGSICVLALVGGNRGSGREVDWIGMHGK